MENELENYKKIFDNSKKEYIEFYTQIKILKQSLLEKNENIQMVTEEVGTWMHELFREKQSHFNSLQIITGYEVKLQTLQNNLNSNQNFKTVKLN